MTLFISQLGWLDHSYLSSHRSKNHGLCLERHSELESFFSNNYSVIATDNTATPFRLLGCRVHRPESHVLPFRQGTWVPSTTRVLPGKLTHCLRD